MMRIRNYLVVLLLLASMGLTLTAQAGVAWESSLEAALSRSKAENKPLLITMHTSTEIACKRMLSNIYTDPDVVAKLRDFVVLPTCVDRHTEVMKMIAGKEEPVSFMFKTVSCKTLMKNERDVRDRFFDKTEVKVPNHIFVGSDGEIFMKKIYELKKKAFLDLLDRALVHYGAKVVDGMDASTQKLFKRVRKGNVKDKEAAVKAILEFENERKTETLYMTIQGLKKEEDRGICIRAMGSDAFSHASATAIKWLSDRSVFIKNCAVVTLEEMKAADATDPLLYLFEHTKKKNKELRKDILRALGPCGAGEPKVKDLLFSHTENKKEIMRLAAYMSLGYFLDEKDVQDKLSERWQKDAKGVAPRTAILFAYMTSKNAELIPQVNALVEGEKNHQLVMLAGFAKQAMRGQKKAGGGGKGGKGGGKGAWRRMRKALAPLYTKDKIVRNQIKRWR